MIVWNYKKEVMQYYDSVNLKEHENYRPLSKAIWLNENTLVMCSY